MSDVNVKINTSTTFSFAVVNDQGALVSGLTNGSFTKTLRDASGASAVSVTIAERGSTGIYDAPITPDALGVWTFLVEHATYGKWLVVFRVTTRATDDLAYPATSGRSLAVSAAGAVDANLAAGAITTASFAAGAIDAAAIGTGAIDADALASDAVTEIQAAVAAGSVASVVGAVGSVTGAVGSVTGAVGSVTGNVGGNVVGTVASVVGAVGSVTGNVGGNVVGSVASVTAGVTLADDAITAAKIAANAIGASELAADAVAEIAAAVSVPSAATIAAAVADESLSGHATPGTLGEAILRLRSQILGTGTLQSASVLDATASSDSQAYRGALLIPTGGTGAGQSGKVISTYNGTTKAFTTYQNFGTALDSTTTYVILSVADYARYVGDVLGSVTTLSAGAITASSISAGAITASKIATDAIGAAQLAADAVAEIQSGLATASAVAAIPTTSAPTANQNADALLDRASAIDGATPRDTLARIAASSHGKVSGMASGSPTFLGQDGATPRIVATVDSDGNRTAVTLP